MKKRTPLILLLLAVCAVLLPMLLPSCANTSQAPSGGKKDTIPPYIIDIRPLPGVVGVPLEGARLIFSFNEYVQIKTPSGIVLSPPQNRPPKARLRGRDLIVTFEEPLLPDMTYTLNFNDAIADANEGNLFPGYTYVFSTGEHIDSMLVTGTVVDCNTLAPVKGATVLLHKDHADSAIFLHRPDAAAKTDDWGFFSIRNIQDTLYRVYALKDANNNNIYEPDQESVAFLDEPFRPKTVINDSLYEFKKFNMKDTALCLARKTDVELNVFREKPSKQFIVKKERVGLRTAFLTFMAPGVKINSMKFRGLPAEKLISQINPQRDSLELWVNDQRKMPDTLQLLINYDKTDTLGNLVPTDEEVKLALDKKMRAELQKSSQRDVKHQDTIAVFKGEVDPTTVEQYGFTVEFQYPLIKEAWDSLVFRSVNPRQQEKIEKYTVKKDPDNLRRFTIMPREKLMSGFDYFLKIPYRKFRDVNGHYNDSTELKVALPTDEKLSTISLELTHVKNRYIVDLLNEKRDKVIRSFIVDGDQTVVFPYVSAGKYCVRLTEDRNKNGLVDTGSILEHRQPEKVLFYKIDDQFLLDIPERTEYTQTIDMEELFR